MNAQLPDALAKALATVIADLGREWRKEHDRICAESRATVAELKNEVLTLKAELKAAAEQETARVTEALSKVKDGAPGKDGEPGPKGEPGERGESGPQGERGEPGEAGPQGEAGLHGELGAPGEVGPQGERGEPGEAGRDGEVGPQGEPGERGALGETGPQGERGEVGEPGRNGEQGPQGEAGEPGTPGEVGSQGEPGVAGEPGPSGEAGPEGPQGKDGASVIAALIDREGQLNLTLADGVTRALGPIVGRDGRDGQNGADGAPGRDGFGFEDVSVVYDGERSLIVRFARGEEAKEFPVTLPFVLDRGVFKEGQAYQRGDGVTWGGSFWIAQDETSEKPDSGKGWRLAVKRGRDGKDGKIPPSSKPVKV